MAQVICKLSEVLLEAGANTDAADNNGRTALHWALIAGDVRIVGLLLGAGASKLKDLAGVDYRAILLRASNAGQVEIVRMLVEVGANKDVVDTDGSSASIAASSQGHVQIVRLLLEAEANLNLAGIDGRTSLMMASDAGHREILSLLLEAGADMDAVDNNGRTALHLALIAGDVEILWLAAEGRRQQAKRSDRHRLLHDSVEGI